MLHALFERLPAVAPADRRTAALRWLERSADVADQEARDELIDTALRVLDDPAFAAVFAPDALAEAPIAATLPDGRVIAGTVDRLCVSDDLVRVIDYKTGRASPSHAIQMTAYRDALAVIFPGRRIEAALLYTATPELVTLPG